MEPVVEKNEVNAYDETPYMSYPYAESSPNHLRTLGRLFGMNPPAVETARVLELGCAEGGNIIPHAVKYPKATFVGVDLSKVQVDNAKEHVKKMGLKNIELKQMSIADIDPGLGKFDYIICHGVISWVPEFVRKKIFEVSSENLSPDGIAYISYNTLPGWNMIRTIRDMMLYHTQPFDDPKEKILQSRILLNFVNEALVGSKTPYALMLKEEAKMLSEHSDPYLRHEHLEDENKQYYFSEFMTEANKHGLQYLSDCSLSSMFVDNMPKQAAEKLAGISSIVKTEQYMDFISNRRFRRTLLCHKDVTLDRGIDKSIAREFAMSASVFPEEPLDEVYIEDNEMMTFYLNKDREKAINTESPEMKALLYTFAENKNNPLEFDELVRQADAKLKISRKAGIEDKLEENAVMLLFKGCLKFSSEPGKRDQVNLDRPKLYAMALYQVRNIANDWITNKVHHYVSANYFEKLAGQYMDGDNTVPQILEKLIKDVNDKGLTIAINERSITDPEELKQHLQKTLDKTIQRFFNKALLV